MKDPLIKRVRYVGLRFTREEFERLEQLKNKTTSTDISEFIRRCVFDKPITVLQRNASLDEFMGVMIRLRNELSAIGSNFNQAARVLNTFNEYPAVAEFINVFCAEKQKLDERTHEILQRLNKIADEWLQ